jgi:hypothetical protein
VFFVEEKITKKPAFHFTHSCQGLFILHKLFLSPPLLHSQAARKAWPFRLQTATLIAASVQPLAQGCFFLRAIFPDAPVHIISDSNKSCRQL